MEMLAPAAQRKRLQHGCQAETCRWSAKHTAVGVFCRCAKSMSFSAWAEAGCRQTWVGVTFSPCFVNPAQLAHVAGTDEKWL